MSEPGAIPNSWSPALLALADGLRGLGYDIETTSDGGPVRDIIARRDMGDRAEMLAIDASGRFRAALTWMVGEWPSRDQIAGVPVHVVDAVSRAVTITGQVESLDQILDVVSDLRENPPWASIAATGAPVSSKS